MNVLNVFIKKTTIDLVIYTEDNFDENTFKSKDYL